LPQIAATILASIAAPGAASAAGGSGGCAVIPQAPSVSGVRCVATPNMACAAERSVVRGGQARIAGRSPETASKVVFLGRKTRRDDIAVRPRHSNDGHGDALVPSKARSGRIAVVDTMDRTATTPGTVQVVEPPRSTPRPAAATGSAASASRRS